MVNSGWRLFIMQTQNNTVDVIKKNKNRSSNTQTDVSPIDKRHKRLEESTKRMGVKRLRYDSYHKNILKTNLKSHE